MVNNSKFDGQGNYLSFDVACRVGFLCVMVGLASFLGNFKNVPGEYYFVAPLIGTVVLFLATMPLGYSHLGCDIRGILGYAFVLELTFFGLQTFDEVIQIYRAVRLYFGVIEYALWCVLVARMFWPCLDVKGNGVSYPYFDFIRPLIQASSSHSVLSTKQKVLGYGYIFIPSLFGAYLGWIDAEFSLMPLFAIPGLVIIVLARRDEASVLDEMEKR